MKITDLFDRKRDQNAEDFINKMIDDGLSEEEALKAWETGNKKIVELVNLVLDGGGNCHFCGKFTPHDSGHNLRYIGGQGDVYVCPECQK